MIHDFGKTALSTDHIIDLYSFSSRVQVGRGYFSLAEIFLFRAVQASINVEFTLLILSLNLLPLF